MHDGYVVPTSDCWDTRLTKTEAFQSLTYRCSTVIITSQSHLQMPTTCQCSEIILFPLCDHVDFMGAFTTESV